MSIRKRNDFLDDGDSEDDAQLDHESGREEESKVGLASRLNKRRKVNSDSEASDDDTIDDKPGARDSRFQFKHHDDGDDFTILDGKDVDENEEGEFLEEGDDEDGDGDGTSSGKTPEELAKSKKKMEKQLLVAQRAARKSGVIYISRVPPFMKPHTLKHFLSPHAPSGLGRIFLTPEDHVAHTRRVKSGGNKKKSFTDGWVEFVSKREARIAAESLNGNIIGGKKGGFYHDDLWNIKYLKGGFKWSHLTEQIANENAERAARLREGIRRTREENKAFVEGFERGKMEEGRERKRAEKEKGKKEAGATDGGHSASIAQRKVKHKEGMDFKQQSARSKSVGKPDEGSGRTLRMVFG
jgi:ESF2/ABP1 family protein